MKEDPRSPQHVHPGLDTTINPIFFNDTFRSAKKVIEPIKKKYFLIPEKLVDDLANYARGPWVEDVKSNPAPDLTEISTNILNALLDDLEFLPSSEDSKGIVWITMRNVQELIDRKKTDLQNPEKEKPTDQPPQAREQGYRPRPQENLWDPETVKDSKPRENQE
jgi:hypothetical protein